MDLKSLYTGLIKRNKKIAIIGLGYVGLPILIALNKYFNVIGFDINKERIASLKKNWDENNEVEDRQLAEIKGKITYDVNCLKDANFFIITVPTPIDKYKNPDLGPVKEATSLIGKKMPPESFIVYESTVYPGVTEDICIPMLENESGLKNIKDFYVGYSPERINPGDKVNTLENIKKIVAAQDSASLDLISSVYGKIIKAGIHRAGSIKVAEAAKVIENTQRDINVALINELAIIFSKLGIDTKEVIDAAKTKWNFLPFYPGLVGGHCIGVDPYYLTYKAKELNYHPEVINAGRRINDGMGEYIADQVLMHVLNSNKSYNKLKLICFGISFKENVTDSRNSRVIDIYRHLQKYSIDIKVYDPVVNKKEVKKYYGIDLIDFQHVKDADAVIFCVAHNCFKEIDLSGLKSRLGHPNPYLFDLKWIFDKERVENAGFKYWRL